MHGAQSTNLGEGDKPRRDKPTEGNRARFVRVEILKGELGRITPSTRLGPTGIRKSSQNACALMLILKAT